MESSGVFENYKFCVHGIYQMAQFSKNTIGLVANLTACQSVWSIFYFSLKCTYKRI